MNNENEIVTGLVLSKKLHSAGWRIPTAFIWAYDGGERILGKVWRVYHRSQELMLIDHNDVLPAAPTSDELFNFIKLKQPNKIFVFELRNTEKMANYLAEYILRNNLLNR